MATRPEEGSAPDEAGVSYAEIPLVTGMAGWMRTDEEVRFVASRIPIDRLATETDEIPSGVWGDQTTAFRVRMVATNIPAPDADRPAGGVAEVSAEEGAADASAAEAPTDASLADGLQTPTIQTPAPVMDAAPLPAAAIFTQAHAPNGSPCRMGPRGGRTQGDQVRQGPYPMGRWHGPLRPHRDDEWGANAPGSSSPA